MNVMLTCAGRRCYMVDFFRESLAGGGRVVAVDADFAAPALAQADVARIVPRVDDPRYLDTVREICVQESVGLLVSLNDLELPILAESLDTFTELGVRAVVSSSEVIDACFDKLKTYKFAAARGIGAVPTYPGLQAALDALRVGELRYPVVVKPRWGSASVGISICEDEQSLVSAANVAIEAAGHAHLSWGGAAGHELIIVQPFMQGEEYGLDVINDLHGAHVAVAGKRKLSMRAGETDRAISGMPRVVEELGHRVGAALGHVGNLDCDVMLVEGVPYLLEMNPRFGGGYPLSHTAGLNVPACLIAWAQGRAIDPAWLQYQSGLTLSKCDRVVVCGSQNGAHLD